MENLQIKSKSKLGLGIVEVLIASLFLGFAALLVAKATTFFAESKTTQTQDEAFLRLVRGIELILNDQTICDGNFRGLIIPDALGTIPRTAFGIPAFVSNTDPSTFARVTDSTPNSFFLGAIEITGMSFQSLSFANSAGPAPFQEYFEMNLEVKRPDGRKGLSTNSMRRTFRFLLEVSDMSPGRTINKCLVPGTVSASGPSADTVQTLCAQMGGRFIAGPPEKCDIRTKVCNDLGVRLDTTTGQCDTQQLRTAVTAPFLGETGICPDGEFIKTLREDGSPVCAPLNDPAPFIVGTLDPTTVCQPCFTTSPVKCTTCDVANPTVCTDTSRYLVYSGGVFTGFSCGIVPGVPECSRTGDYNLPTSPKFRMNCAP
jgi:hypothetical protein